jgi:hypothetical protein
MPPSLEGRAGRTRPPPLPVGPTPAVSTLELPRTAGGRMPHRNDGHGQGRHVTARLTSHGLLHLREHERGTSHHASVNEGRRTTRSRTAQPTTVHEECMTRSLKTVGGLEEGGTHGRHGKGAAIDRHPTKNAWPQLVSTIHSFHPFFFTPGRANATIAGGWPSCSIPSVRSTVVSSVP